MFRVYFDNFDYTSQEAFDTYSEAYEHGKSKGFEFTIKEYL